VGTPCAQPVRPPWTPAASAVRTLSARCEPGCRMAFAAAAFIHAGGENRSPKKMGLARAPGGYATGGGR
jgi:hypothetical protein